QLLYSICLHGRAELGLAPDEYAGLTMVLLRLLAFKPAQASGAGGGAEKKSTPTEPAATRPVAQPAAPLQGAAPGGERAVAMEPRVAAPRSATTAPAVPSAPPGARLPVRIDSVIARPSGVEVKPQAAPAA